MKVFSIQKIKKTVCVLVACISLAGARGQGNVSYISFYSQNSFTNKSIDQSKQVGVLLGNSSVSNGAASYSIPIYAPQRPEGAVPAPSISVVYNSQLGDGVLGRGWSITGISSIQRVQKTIVHNGSTQPSCTSSDEFTWDGQKLYLKSNQGGGVQIWGTEIENFSLIKSYRDASNRINKWEIVTKDGIKMYYGESVFGSNTRLLAQNSSGQNTDCNSSGGAFISFYLDYMEFPNGQGRWYHYHYPGNRSVYLQSIEDNYGVQIFSYKIRSDVNQYYLNGRKFVNDLLLDQIEVKNYNGSLLRKYNFKYSYDNINSFLSEAIESNSTGQEINPTIFLYGEQSNTGNFVKKSDVGATISPAVSNGKYKLQSGDFNGDGLTDILQIDQTTVNNLECATSYKILAGDQINGDGFFFFKPNSVVNSDAVLQESHLEHLGVYNSDYDGDNIDDIAVHNITWAAGSAFPGWRLDDTKINYFDKNCQAVQSSIVSQPKYPAIGTATVYNVIPPKQFYYTGDFNGDGATDYFLLTSSAVGSTPSCFISAPSKSKFNLPLILEGTHTAGTCQGTIVSDIGDADEIKILDFDGDGKSEIMIIKEGTTKIYTITYFSDCYTEARLIYNGGFPTKWHNVHLGDFNGDRKTDILCKSTAIGWTIYLSNGNTFENVYSFPANYPSFNYKDNNFNLSEIADFNGDGKADILVSFIKKNAPVSGNVVEFVDVYYSRGSSFYKKSYSGGFANLPAMNTFGINENYLIGDFNGDGKADINVSADHNLSYRWNVYFDANRTDLLLNKVKNGFGAETEFMYSTLPRLRNLYTASLFENYESNFQISNWQSIYYATPPLSVVYRYKNEEGKVDLSYQYQGAIISKQGRGFLGYRVLSEKDNKRNIVTSTWTKNFFTYNNFHEIFLPYKTKVDDVTNPSNIINLETTDYLYQNGLPSIVNSAPNKFIWPRVYQTTNSSYFKGNSINYNYYDSYGNVTSTEATDADGRKTTNSFDYGTNTQNRPCLPVTHTKIYTMQGLSDVSYTTKFEYNSLHQVQKKIEFFGLPKTVTTEYQYNMMGIVSEIKTTGTGIAPRISTFEYNHDDRYLFKGKNTLGQETIYNTSPLWNLPLSVTDIGGLTQTMTYDNWGRKLTETSPTGEVINTNRSWQNGYSFGGQSYQNVYKITQSSSGTPTTNEYYDKIQNKIGAEVQHYSGGYSKSLMSYDDRNRMYKTEHIGPNNPTAMGNHEYSIKEFDQYDRLTFEGFKPISKFSTTILKQYNYTKGSNYWITQVSIPASSTNPNGRMSSSKKSLGGVLLESNENGINTLEFTYDAEGKNLKTINSGVTLSESQYDGYGRRIKLIDNSAGISHYKYNALGELIEQSNANGGWQKSEYDNIGRKTKEIINEGTITYTYFAPGSGVKTNLIKEIKGYQNQNKEVYDYDAFGRLNKVVKSIYTAPTGTSIYTTEYTYDTKNRLIQKKSPTGNIYDYSYAFTGDVQAIYKNTQAIYSLISVNDANQVKDYFLGSVTPSNLVTRTFDDYHRITGISGTYINDNYEWDFVNGNLESKTEGRQGFSYAYVYDQFERLTEENLTATSPMAGIRTINNETPPLDNGNLDVVLSAIKPSGTTPFAYHSSKQFAISTVEEADNFSQFQQEVYYSSFNKPTRIAQGGLELKYTYDHSMERISSVLTGPGKFVRRYYVGNTEYNYDNAGNLLHAIDYIYVDGAIVAMDISNSNQSKLWYVQTDYQDNIRAVFDNQGSVHYINYDAWGKYRVNDPMSMQHGDISYDKPITLPDWIYRGYTGQEHLAEFRLINLNARLYDPHVGRLLSPDNYVTANSLQGFNRYSYCHNNPLKFVDKDGNDPILAGILIGMGVGAFLGGVSANGGNFNPLEWDYNYRTFSALFLGGIVGATSGLVGGAVATSLPFGGFGGGALSGAAAGFTNSVGLGIPKLVQGNGYNLGSLLGDVAFGTTIGGLVGGLAGGIEAVVNGDRFIDGYTMKIRQVDIVNYNPANNSSKAIEPSNNIDANWMSRRNPVNNQGNLKTSRRAFGDGTHNMNYPNGRTISNLSDYDIVGDISIRVNHFPSNGTYGFWADGRLIQSTTSSATLNFTIPGNTSIIDFGVMGSGLGTSGSSTTLIRATVRSYNYTNKLFGFF